MQAQLIQCKLLWASAIFYVLLATNDFAKNFLGVKKRFPEQSALYAHTKN